jgi:hypothetical protein
VTGNVAGLDMNFIPKLDPLRSEGMAWNNNGSGTIPNLSSSIDWSLTGLAPNATFDMCVYGMWANFNRSFNITIQGTTQNVPTFDATTSSPRRTASYLQVSSQTQVAQSLGLAPALEHSRTPAKPTGRAFKSFKFLSLNHPH